MVHILGEQKEKLATWMPKVTHAQEAMEALDDAIQDNIVGITQAQADEHVRFLLHQPTGVTVVLYKEKPIILCGLRKALLGREEFFIEVKNTVSA